MANTARDLISTAEADLGIKEKPAGSNNVKYTRWYGMVGSPWCAMAVSYWANKAGIPTSVIPKHAYTPDGKAFFKKRGRWHSSPKVGDIVYYNIGGMGRVSHVGIVVKVHKDGSWIALEGNTDAAGGRTGGKVMLKHRYSTGSGGGFGRPAYDPAAKPSKKITKKATKAKKKTAKKAVKSKPKFPLPKGHWYGPESSNSRNHSGYWEKDRAAIRLIQAKLKVKVTGRYSIATRNAVRKFQAKKKLRVDGAVGSVTWSKMFA